MDGLVKAAGSELAIAALVEVARAQEGREVSTIQRALVAVCQAHQAAGLESPTKTALVREVVKGPRRSRGVAPTQKSPPLADDIKALLGSAVRSGDRRSHQPAALPPVARRPSPAQKELP